MSQFMRNVSSKRDLTYALGVKGKIYLLVIVIVYCRSNILPEKRYCTLAYLKGILSGAKQFFRNSEVRSVNVPRYKSMSLKHVLTFASSLPKIMAYLPD